MSITRREFVVGASAMALGIGALGMAGCGSGNSVSSDNRIIYGSIYTGVGGAVADALVIKDGKIAYCGTADGAKKYAGSKMATTELEKGQLVIPGLIDGHCHPALAWNNKLNSVMFEQTDKLEDYKRKLADYIQKNPDKAGYGAKGWLTSEFEGGLPTANILDEVCSDKPVVATDSGGHAVWCNTKALELLFDSYPDFKYVNPERPGRDTLTVNGGTIVRDSDGKATGCFLDGAAGLPQKVLPDATKEDYIKSIESALDEYASIGYTAYVEAMINESTDVTKWPKIDAYMQLDKEGKLPLHVNGAFIVANKDNAFELVEKALEFREQTKGGRFRVSDIKIFMDGVVEGGSAYLSKEYADKAGYFGSATWGKPEDLEKLTKIIAKANEQGMAVHFHAIGDQASTDALDCIAKAAESIGIDKVRESRNVITHLQIVDEASYAKFKEYNVVASLSPWGEKSPDFYEKTEVAKLGRDRAEKEYPIKTFLDNGINCAFGTDYGSSFIYVFNKCYHVLVSRTDENLDPTTCLNPSECLTSEEALNLMSQGGAYQMKRENDFGTLEAGKCANLVILDRNVLEISSDDAVKTQILKTMVDGVWLT